MPISNDSLNKKLYQLLKTQGFDPVPKNSKGDTTPVPDDADVFRFTFKVDGKPVGPAWVTVDSNQELKVYYNDEVMDGLNEDGGEGHIDDFTEFLKQLKQWAQRRQLGFDLENQDHLESDMAQREHTKKKEQVNEGYYPMGKTASYNDSVPSVKIVLQHTRAVQEGEQRFRNIAKIFLENTAGERILAPTTRPGIAKVYARHLAEGGLPHDDRWGHIGSLVEEYSKMAGFVRATRNGQFNESAQQLVSEGINHYQSLRETLSRMTGHRGYNAYFESYTPQLMENEGEESLNELFVQETLDPRIESVMPILSRIHKKVNEMSEVDALAEWADSIVAEKMVMGASTDASASGTFTEEESRTSNNPGGIPEGMLGNPGVEDNPVVNAITRRILMQRTDLLAKYGPEKVMNAIDDVADFVGDTEEIGSSDVSGWVRQVEQSLGNIDESALQAYLGNKKYGKDGMDALRKAGSEHSSEKKMQNIRAKFSNKEEEVAEDLDADQKRVGQLGPTEKVKNNNIGKLVGTNENFINTDDQAVVTEMDKSEDNKGPEGKATPVKAKDFAKDAEKKLDKEMDKAHKKEVKEGQEDLEAILRIVKK